MNTFQSIIKRIKELINSQDDKMFSFTIIENGCTDCSQCPTIPYEGKLMSISHITIENDNVHIHGRNELDCVEFSIDKLCMDNMITILRAMENHMGVPNLVVNRKFSFPIANLSREDITALGYKGAETISDELMNKIARKMGESYLENSYWIDLEIMVDTYCGLEKGEVEND